MSSDQSNLIPMELATFWMNWLQNAQNLSRFSMKKSRFARPVLKINLTLMARRKGVRNVKMKLSLTPNCSLVLKSARILKKLTIMREEDVKEQIRRQVFVHLMLQFGTQSTCIVKNVQIHSLHGIPQPKFVKNVGKTPNGEKI